VNARFFDLTPYANITARIRQDSFEEHPQERANLTHPVTRTSLPAWRLPLRTWQHEAFESWIAQRPEDALFVATPGAGKTRFAARLTHALLTDRAVSRVIVVVPREHLKAQFARAMAGAWIQLDHKFRNGDRTLAHDLHGAVVTYQQVAAAPRTFAALTRVPTLVVFDEIHHAGEQATWGQALRDAFGEARYRICLSGTPFRSDGARIPFVQYHAGECVAHTSYDYAQALNDGVCRALVFPMQGGEAEWISRDGEQMRAGFEEGVDKRYMSERLRTALTQPAWLGDVLERAHLKLLETRAQGHPDAGGLIAAMNQEHARFVADLLEKRVGVRTEPVVSDLDDASRRIVAFGKSRDPWIVAVHMISEGVDIPRLRIGVFASNVVSELYFRQFCGRFVRTGSDPQREREAFVYLADDPRLRIMASSITDDVRRSLRAKRKHDEVAAALAAAQRTEHVPDEGAYASISATAREGKILDFGPLFNPTAYYATPEPKHETPLLAHEPQQPEYPEQTHAERRELLRRELQSLVALASTTFSVNHKLVHATLNERFGGKVATASITDLEARRRLIHRWLERRVYDGLR
jgi:superfamily II DNA or RNA helicase